RRNDPGTFRAAPADQHADGAGTHVAVDRDRSADRPYPDPPTHQPALPASARLEPRGQDRARLRCSTVRGGIPRDQEDRRHQGLGGGIVIISLLIGLVLTAFAVTLIARAFIVSRL